MSRKYRVDFVSTVYGGLIERIYIFATSIENAKIFANENMPPKAKFFEVMEVKNLAFED